MALHQDRCLLRKIIPQNRKATADVYRIGVPYFGTVGRLLQAQSRLLWESTWVVAVQWALIYYINIDSFCAISKASVGLGENVVA